MHAYRLTGVLAFALVASPLSAQVMDARSLLDGRQTEVTDYYAIKEGLPPTEFQRLRRDVFAELSRRHPNVPGQVVVSCETAQEARVIAELELANAAATPERWRQDKAAARQALEALAEAGRRLRAQEPVEGPYVSLVPYFQSASSAPDPRVRQLAARAGEDQLAGINSMIGPADLKEFRDLSPAARAYVMRLTSMEACRRNKDNSTWLKADLAANGWFAISKYGAQADSAAFLLVQHSDHDRAFQARVLEMLTDLVRSGDTRPQNYAYLHDRIAVGAGRPQRYATQGRCGPSGGWAPFEMEEPAKVDQHRRELGLEPLDSYKARFRCPPGSAPPR